MYLKSIEIHGFKSFANKLVFDFHNGITGIVGPNGSGKSNVADAVRWVLGEQSAKQLRGSSMQDVIFSGTEARKPLSYAYVAITMDNSDHELPVDYVEVTVARRVYRSGESEYLLNGSPCRLKDVNELFYDTGIGKEGYSIIGQGQIDKILSGKPEERRELFDEAAGIVKFKRRKATTIKKLENERDNLTRIKDILGELEGRVGPLELQASKAKDYLRKKEELKTLEINSFLLDMERIEGELAELNNKYNIAKENLERAQADKVKNETSYGDLQANLGKLDEGIENLRNEISEASLTREKLEGQIVLISQQIESAKSFDEQFISRIDTVSDRISRLGDEKKAYEEALVAIDEELTEASAKTDVLSASLEEIRAKIAKDNDVLEKNAIEISDILNTRITNRTRAQRVETTTEQLNIQKATLTKRQLERKTEENGLLEEMNKKKDELDSLKEALDKKISAIDAEEKKVKEWDEKLVALRKESESSMASFHQAKSRLDSLVNLAERYEGYGGSIKRVLEHAQGDKKVHGTVADIISVDKKYETAIETALGGNIQNVVTSDEATAKSLISFLKETKGGRVTFLPITTVKGGDTSKYERAIGKPGVIGMANTLIDCDNKYLDIVSYLLGRVVVCDHIDNALDLASEFKYSLHIVTLEGEYLAPGGSIAGGAFKNSSNLLGRNREIAELESKIKKLSADMAEGQKRVEEITTARELTNQELIEMRDELQQSYLGVNTAKLNYERALEDQKESHKVFEELGKESEGLEIQLAELAAEKVKISEEAAELNRRQTEIEDMNEKLGAAIESYAKEEEEARNTLSEAQIAQTALQQRKDFTRENIDRIDGELKDAGDEKTSLTQQMESGRADSLKKTTDIEEIKKTIDASEAKIEALKKELDEQIAQKTRLNSENQDFYKKNDEINQQITDLEKEILRLETSRQKLDESKESQNNHIWAEYELTYHNAMSLRDETLTNLPEIKKQTYAIKDQIRALGDVNVNAIEEYKTVSERYNFLKGQHDDLIEAEKTLCAIIDELDEGMRKQFTEQFAIIQKEFDTAFKELFGGGKGTLELALDEDDENKDILECGIRIIAQPPGKKLQNMVLLSGGEKALTAIALLFAIQNMKPSPFCLLDEIEAALDDNNVDRFAKYLNKLTKHTQFIIITHRRGTMNAADRLYGITMQEKGISTLVSVNLIESDLN